MASLAVVLLTAPLRGLIMFKVPTWDVLII
jgi:hypothetical protein